MKMKKYKTTTELAESLGLSPQAGYLADIKANMTKEIIKLIKKQGITHKELSEASGVPRTAITGIVSGSLQKVTIDRLIRIINALGKTVDFKLRKAA